MATVKALTDDRDTVDVLLSTEGTYPYFSGGVSQWCDMLLRGMKRVRYSVYAVVSQPYYARRYEIPERAELVSVSLWGTEDPAEILDLPASTLYRRRQKVTRTVVVDQFLPLFEQVLDAVWSTNRDGARIGVLFYDLYLFFSEYDYASVFKDRAVWDFYMAGLRRGSWGGEGQAPTLVDAHITGLRRSSRRREGRHRPFDADMAGLRRSSRGGEGQAPTLFDAHQTFGWLYRFFVILSTPIPKMDLVHSSASAFCGIPGIIAKLRYNTPFLATEHGVYLREQYLSIGNAAISTFSKQFLIGLIHMVVAANYAHADLIAPVASYNARWERRMGVASDHIRVIYNGVDEEMFLSPTPRAAGAPPTVVAVARIDPNKDILSLIEAANIVRQSMPEVRFVVYGGVSVPAYYERCLERCSALGLGDAFVFKGHVDDVASAYASGDVVVLSSITEGFPYAVIEAMMSGRPVVATDVGGITEAVDGTGILVPPQDPKQLAGGIVRLLQDANLRVQLAEEARARALDLFTSSLSLQRYRETYSELAARNEHAQRVVSLLDRRREEAITRGDSLRRLGQLKEALQEYRLAASVDPDSVSTTHVLVRIAEVYGEMGDHERSREELMRAQLHLWAATQQYRSGGVAATDVRQMAQESPWL